MNPWQDLISSACTKLSSETFCFVGTNRIIVVHLVTAEGMQHKSLPVLSLSLFPSFRPSSRKLDCGNVTCRSLWSDRTPDALFPATHRGLPGLQRPMFFLWRDRMSHHGVTAVILIQLTPFKYLLDLKRNVIHRGRISVSTAVISWCFSEATFSTQQWHKSYSSTLSLFLYFVYYTVCPKGPSLQLAEHKYNLLANVQLQHA